MSHIIYFDTSALAKWYINESQSEEVEAYLQENGPVAVSDLTVVEMRCLLARRRREKDITVMLEAEIFATFQEDMRRKVLICHPFPAELAAGAVNLMSILGNIPVRSLDAMHLVIAKEIGADVLVTADKVMADAATAYEFEVVRY
ncbi:MAG TPA: type II toxin-antitoxin system VapC family toxin [Desulfuromonadales bacterium]|nr:type II toxin-antitoxin system VapC family toxin [Desulfuromonadales bacterium]